MSLELNFKEEWTLIWWYIVDHGRFELYHQGVQLGMNKKYAFKRACQYGKYTG